MSRAEAALELPSEPGQDLVMIVSNEEIPEKDCIPRRRTKEPEYECPHALGCCYAGDGLSNCNHPGYERCEIYQGDFDDGK